MRSAHTAQLIASGAALAFLFLGVTTTTYFYAPRDDFLPATLGANVLAFLTALAAWSGALFKRRGNQTGAEPQDWLEWVGLFFIASALGSVFLYIDCGGHFPTALGGTTCEGNPGISLVFTVAALALSAIALPSALRAWLLTRLGRHRPARQ